MKWLAIIAITSLAACSSPGTGFVPVNICLLAQCEQEATTGNGDLSESGQEADVEVGL
jgi:uncharacterized lipoprotein YmbA